MTPTPNPQSPTVPTFYHNLIRIACVDNATCSSHCPKLTFYVNSFKNLPFHFPFSLFSWNLQTRFSLDKFSSFHLYLFLFLLCTDLEVLLILFIFTRDFKSAFVKLSSLIKIPVHNFPYHLIFTILPTSGFLSSNLNFGTQCSLSSYELELFPVHFRSAYGIFFPFFVILAFKLTK